jgi:hypothetical protein
MSMLVSILKLMFCTLTQQERAHAQAEKMRARQEVEKMMQANKSLRDARAQAHEKELVSALCILTALHTVPHVYAAQLFTSLHKQCALA